MVSVKLGGMITRVHDKYQTRIESLLSSFTRIMLTVRFTLNLGSFGLGYRKFSFLLTQSFGFFFWILIIGSPNHG